MTHDKNPSVAREWLHKATDHEIEVEYRRRNPEPSRFLQLLEDLGKIGIRAGVYAMALFGMMHVEEDKLRSLAIFMCVCMFLRLVSAIIHIYKTTP